MMKISMKMTTTITVDVLVLDLYGDVTYIHNHTKQRPIGIFAVNFTNVNTALRLISIGKVWYKSDCNNNSGRTCLGFIWGCDN
jgi:hypothetical protein